ncbi:hypothetical protein FOCC_FOCC011401 [Frankliniella occidentalis]|nr:hypothetical protein FOCC_FOCC011401 [Frankliniella occidentalis]
MPIHLKEGITFSCPYPKCGAQVGTVSSFRSHVSHAHTRKEQYIEESWDPSINSSECETQSSYENNEPSQESQSSSGKSKQRQESQSEVNATADEDDSEDSELYPEYAAKDQLAKFYLKLEAVHYLPTSTVQIIADEIQLVTEMSHHFLKRRLESELKTTGLDKRTIIEIVANTFRSDPVFNIHHKGKDVEQLGTNHLRQKFWKSHYPFVEPKEIFLGLDENGRKKLAHYVSIRESINIMLQDPQVKNMVLDSFKIKKNPDILSDITDGSAFAKHMEQHHGGKCLYINLFQDGFDYAAFGPSQGVYKPIGFYFVIGNIKPEYRTKIDLIQMVYMILEKHLRNSEQEELNDIDKLKEVLRPLIAELEDLKVNGIFIDGEQIPVCLLFGQGDNLGQHVIGAFVGSFSCQHSCRFCPISLAEFRENPTITKPLRTPEEYDSAVADAKQSWRAFRKKCLLYAERKKANAQHGRLLDRVRAPGSKNTVKRILAKTTLDKLKGIHSQGVKYRPSALNSVKLGFHVCQGPSLSVCVAHDLFEGIAKNMLPKILKYFIDKQWFDLPTLNRRIRTFHYEGSDAADGCTPLKSLKALGGNASENWTLIRLLPLLLGDLVKDKEDEMWQLFLKFKLIVEYVCAPKITISQVLYLKSLIREYLTDVKRLLPQCLYPKQHLLMHYPELITIFGPLIRLFTLRFESKHIFFKNVAKACRNFINITYTLSRKYACRFAYDHSTKLLEEDVLYKSKHSSFVIKSKISEERKAVIPDEFLSEDIFGLTQVSVKGVSYTLGEYMVLDSLGDFDLKVGFIDMIFLNKSTEKVYFLMNVKPALNTFQGYYKIMLPASSYQFASLDSLLDYHPLPSYTVGGQQCIVLKHTMIKM